MRTEIDVTIYKKLVSAGNVVAIEAGVAVTVYDIETAEVAPVYLAETGATVLAQPLICDERGRLPGYVQEGKYRLEVGGSDPHDQFFNAVDGRSPGGRGHGYAEIQSSFPTTQDVSNIDDVDGLTFELEAGVRDTTVRWYMRGVKHTTAGGEVGLMISDGANRILSNRFVHCPTAGKEYTALLERRLMLDEEIETGSGVYYSPGTIHTIKARIWVQAGGGTVTLIAAVAGRSYLEGVDR